VKNEREEKSSLKITKKSAEKKKVASHIEKSS
jgi:hypothetical protein